MVALLSKPSPTMVSAKTPSESNSSSVSPEARTPDAAPRTDFSPLTMKLATRSAPEMQRAIHDAARPYVMHFSGPDDFIRACIILQGKDPGPVLVQQVPYLGREIIPKRTGREAFRVMYNRQADTVTVAFPASTNIDKIAGIHLVHPLGTKFLAHGKRVEPNSFVFNKVNGFDAQGLLLDCKVLVENRTSGMDFRKGVESLFTRSGVSRFAAPLFPNALNVALADNYHFNLGAALE